MEDYSTVIIIIIIIIIISINKIAATLRSVCARVGSQPKTSYFGHLGADRRLQFSCAASVNRISPRHDALSVLLQLFFTDNNTV
jgi:hypothetical protein